MPNERNIRITTPLGPDVLLFEEMTGRESLGSPFDYTVTVVSDDLDLDLTALLGEKINIEVDLPELNTTRYFSAYVTSFAHVGVIDERSRYQLTLRPWLWLLTMTSNCRIFQRESATQIVKKIWAEHGFTDVREDLLNEPKQLEYSVQYRESDFNYCDRLLEHEGIYYFFEHAVDKHTLVLADHPSAHKPIKGYEEIPFFPPANAERRQRDHLWSWAVSSKMRPGAFVTTDYDFKKPKADLTGKLKLPGSHSLGDFEMFDYPGYHLTSKEGEDRAKVRLQEHQADQQLVSASGNAMGLSVGSLFTLTGYPRQDQNKQHLIVAASYHLETNAYISGGGSETEFQGSYTLVPATHNYRAPATTPKPRIEGPQTATVVGKSGEEIWSNKDGCVKVQFHWDRKGESDENSSCWVRVSQNWAGSGWGSQFIPRIGQEVIVDFLEGNPDRPIIIGGVYNGSNALPYDIPAKQTQSGIKSRSTKGGTQSNANEIRFEDKKGSEELYIQAEKNQKVLVKAAQSVNVGAAQTITVGGNRTLNVTGETAETHSKSRKSTIKESDTIIVELGNQNIKAEKGEANVLAKNVHIKATNQILIDLGGAKIMIDMAGNVTVVGTMIKLNSGG